MSAIPKIELVSLRPLERPVYDNRSTSRFDWWFSNNESDLRRYWQSILDVGDEEVLTEEDFLDFARVQYECERDRVAEWQDDTRQERWSAHDEDTGIPKWGPI